jgi:DeoR family transcriptional regulator of aga operon
MPRTPNSKLLRANQILELLSEKDYVSVIDLADQLDVSAVTVRKDLADLEGRGLLRRTHGGAIPLVVTPPEVIQLSQNFADNEQIYRAAKIAIAREAATFVDEGATIAFTGGTTVTHVARQLCYTPRLTVITNAVNIVLEMSGFPDVTIFVPGGFLRGGMYSLVSISALDRIRNFNIDTMFIGLNGFHPEHGLTELLNDQAIVHKTLMENSKKLIAVADHTKLGRVFKAHMCPTSDIDVFITNDLAPPEIIDQIRAGGVDVRLVAPDDD